MMWSGRHAGLLIAVGVSLVACEESPPEVVACDADGRCPLAGYICLGGVCQVGDSGSANSSRLGRRGGTVVGVDGVKLVVPADALTGTVTFSIARQSQSARPPGLTTVSRVYEIGPSGTAFAVAATVVIPYSSTDIPTGHSASEVAVWRAEQVAGPWVPLDAGTPDMGTAAGLTSQLSYFVAALPESAAPSDGGPADGGPTDGGPNEEEPIGGGDSEGPSAGDPGDSFQLDCSVDPAICPPANPICTTDTFGQRVCTGTCQFASDCPGGYCCLDTLSDGNPNSILCVETPAGGCPDNLGIPDNRPCSFDVDCARGGICAAGQCYAAGSSGAALPGDPCASPTECDLDVADACVHKADGTGACGFAGEPCDLWSVEDIETAPVLGTDACATLCSGSTCGAGDTCRLAMPNNGSTPIRACVPSASAGAVVPLYATCRTLNHSVCDPAEADRCLLFELSSDQTACVGLSDEPTCLANPRCRWTGVCEQSPTFCSKACEPQSEETDCGAGNRCCAEPFIGGTWCVPGQFCQ